MITPQRTASNLDVPVNLREHGRFVLSRPHGTVSAMGSRAQYEDSTEAAHALRSGSASTVVGALPFALDERCALYSPDTVSFSPSHWTPPHAPIALPDFEVSLPPDADHVNRVAAAVNILRDSHSELQKVVMARTIELSARKAVDPLSVLASLVSGNPSGDGYHVDLSAAGGSYVGKTLVGSSPEVLIRRHGRAVTCYPLAGSAPRHPDAQQDRTNGRVLSESAKDLREHMFVVDAIREALEPLCAVLTVPNAPSLTSTPQLWHLGTPIRGELASTETTALDLARALHPTPAVCGTPTATAYRTIDALEGERGFYAGTVGWCSSDGDGEWIVAIRCVEISADRHRVTAYAGGGIIAESDPESELRETVAKFGTVITALRASL
ncbi:isochorismate synthase [Rhodococcoides yunnanense]|uniref:isochorismate synthase n=1 Tax=Rhodococcoides yunnanense TaxID=278209 RepID=UPI000A069A3A|nr:isochorismate synthase [Rhodococcus yunnanensis]